MEMSSLNTVILLTLFSGLAVPLGAILASVRLFKLDWLDTEFKHIVIALGATFLVNKKSALLLACLIALQNMPEGFNAFYELQALLLYVAVAYLLPVKILIVYLIY